MGLDYITGLLLFTLILEAIKHTALCSHINRVVVFAFMSIYAKNHVHVLKSYNQKETIFSHSNWKPMHTVETQGKQNNH
jgi:cytosine/uracil/thiamine/allantoin permease